MLDWQPNSARLRQCRWIRRQPVLLRCVTAGSRPQPGLGASRFSRDRREDLDPCWAGSSVVVAAGVGQYECCVGDVATQAHSNLVVVSAMLK